MAHLLGSPTEEKEALPWPLTEEELREKLRKERIRHHSPSAPIYVAPIYYSSVDYKKVKFTPMLHRGQGASRPHYDLYAAHHNNPSRGWPSLSIYPLKRSIEREIGMEMLSPEGVQRLEVHDMNNWRTLQGASYPSCFILIKTRSSPTVKNNVGWWSLVPDIHLHFLQANSYNFFLQVNSSLFESNNVEDVPLISNSLNKMLMWFPSFRI